MPLYTFETLSPNEFETLCRDLLQNELGITLESFKSGRDDGIDLRFASNQDNELIVQCKHYVRSSVASLLRHLSSNEAPKVARLRPARYVLATSLGLTPANKRSIEQVFTPHCAQVTVYGADDLNNLLGLFPEVERAHFKLWLTGTTILERILHAGIHNRTRVELEQLQRKLRVYAPNRSFVQARQLLERHGFVIIAGIPGIGKSTLAEVLLFDHMSEGYEPVRVYSAAEAFDVLKSEGRQIIYYDDFLGATAFDAGSFGRGEDRQVLALLSHVSDSGGRLRLLLTTRDYILNQARLDLESLDQAGLHLRRYVLDLHMYTRADRALILYNHLYFATLPEGALLSVLQDRAYLNIIDHPHYSPRVIELMTAQHDRLGAPDMTFAQSFLAALDHPTALWSTAYERHLSPAARHLLLVLVAAPADVLLPELRPAFEALHSDAAAEYHLRRSPSDFQMALKELEGTFVRIQLSGDGKDQIVSFHNPSVRDFLEGYLAAHASEVQRICRTTTWFDSCRWLWGQPSIGGLHSGRPVPVLPRLRPALLTDPETLVAAVRRTLNHPDPRRPGRARPVSHAARLLFIRGMFRDGLDKRWELELMDAAKRALDASLAAGQEEFIPLLRLARTLRDDAFSIVVKSYVLSEIKRLQADQTGLRDEGVRAFRAWLDFRHYFPHLVQPEDNAVVTAGVGRLGAGWDLESIADRYYGDWPDNDSEVEWDDMEWDDGEPDDEDGIRRERLVALGSDEGIDRLFDGLR